MSYPVLREMTLGWGEPLHSRCPLQIGIGHWLLSSVCVWPGIAPFSLAKLEALATGRREPIFRSQLRTEWKLSHPQTLEEELDGISTPSPLWRGKEIQSPPRWQGWEGKVLQPPQD